MTSEALTAFPPLRNPIALPFSLLLLAVLIYAGTFSHPFVHDDIVFIVQNPHISHWDNIAAVFAGTSTPAAAGVNAYYRPLLEIIYRLEYLLFGLNPTGWHIVNALVHGINGVLVFALLSILGIRRTMAWFVAAIFVVHPVQTEAVACVAGISNLLMGFFVLSTLVLYTRRQWIAAFLFFILGLLTKEQALIAIPLIIALDLYRGQKPWAMWGLFAAIAVNFLLVRQGITGAHVLRDIIASTGELRLRLLSIGQTLITYVRILICPFDLHYYRSTDILTANPWWWAVVALLAWGIVKSSALIRLGSAWFVLSLLPVLNIVPLINEYSFILTAEHFLYLPMIGVAIALCELDKWCDERLKLNFAPKTQAMLCGLLLGAFAGMSIFQNQMWKSEVTLFERTVEYEPDFARGHLLLAKAYYFERRYEQANIHFDKAYTRMSEYATKAVGEAPQRFYHGFMKGILFDWAHSLEDSNALPMALRKYMQAIAIDRNDPVLWNNLGVVQLKMGSIDDARHSFGQALTLNPQFAPAQMNARNLSSPSAPKTIDAPP